jgi:quercetin dioxygenase-like cupin family protein
MNKDSDVIRQDQGFALPKSQAHVILEVVQYVPDSIVCKTIIKNIGGKLSVVAFDEGEKFCEKLSEYDLYVQVIDGNTVVTIDHQDLKIKLGESIIIPVNTWHCFKASEQFKMITTIIKESA